MQLAWRSNVTYIFNTAVHISIHTALERIYVQICVLLCAPMPRTFLTQQYIYHLDISLCHRRNTIRRTIQHCIRMLCMQTHTNVRVCMYACIYIYICIYIYVYIYAHRFSAPKLRCKCTSHIFIQHCPNQVLRTVLHK